MSERITTPADVDLELVRRIDAAEKRVRESATAEARHAAEWELLDARGEWNRHRREGAQWLGCCLRWLASENPEVFRALLESVGIATVEEVRQVADMAAEAAVAVGA